MSAAANNNQVSQNIQVAVRCRPLNDREKKGNSTCVIECIEKRKEVVAYERNSLLANNKTFTFDRVFGPNSKQADVYNQVVRPVVNEVIEGYNCTIFAYGQTGTGKTFTMEGERSPNVPEESAWEDDPMVGIIPRSVAQLFSTLNAMTNCEFSVKVSFIELYNEELTDLLGDPNVEKSLRIYDDPNRKGSVNIPGLEEVIVKSKSEVYKILQKGADRRRKAETLMNSNSSRSHSIFSLTLLIKEKSIDADSLKGEETLKIGKLNLVDLAGSENIERSGATGKRATEAGKINKSLTTLGRVITALVEHRDHIPYRESNLTRLLQDSLGGRTKTTIIATISPAQCNIEETLSTLDYAHKAKSIRNKPEVNQKLVKKAVIKEFNDEIDRLKRELWASREKNGVHLPLDIYQETQQTVERQKDEIRELTIKNQTVGDELLKLTEMHEATKQTLDEKIESLANTVRTLGETQMKLTQAEIDCDETKYLLDEHVSTERLLYSQATEVVQMLQASQKDNGVLLKKVSELRDVMSVNRGAVDAYAHETVQSMDQMNREEIEAQAGNELLIDSLVQSVQREKEIVDELVESRVKPELDKFEKGQNSWLEGLKKCIEEEVKAKMDAYCRTLTQQFCANMDQRTKNMEKCEKSCSKQRSEHDRMSESLSGVYSTHRHETLDFQRRFEKANSTWLDETTSSVFTLSEAAQNAFCTHLNESNTTREQMHAMQREMDDFKRKMDERDKQVSEKCSIVMEMFGQIVSLQSQSKSLMDASYADWSLRFSEMSRRSELANERATEEALWIRRQCKDLETALRESNESVIRSTHNQIVDLNLKYIEQAEHVSKRINDNFDTSNNHFVTSLKNFHTFEEDKSSELQKMTLESSKHLDSMCEKIEQEIKINQNLIADTLAQLSEETLDQEKATFEDQIGNTLHVCEQIKTSIDNRSRDYMNFLSNGIGRVNDLTEKKLKNEEPSGRTPKRKSSSPQDNILLTKTRSHTELLDSYRRRNQVDMVQDDEFKEPQLPPVSPGPVDSSSSNSSSLTQPSSKRAAYGSVNDLENMCVDSCVDSTKPITTSQKTLTVPRSFSSKALLVNQKKTAAVLKDKNS